MTRGLTNNLLNFVMENYCEIVDKALGNSFSKFRTLRTCLDPGSNEWNETTMPEKLEILRKVSETKNLSYIFLLYKKTFIEMNKQHVAERLEEGLTQLLCFTFDDTSILPEAGKFMSK